jgi:nucleotide-binding universal stress UspA family protein
MLRNVIAAVDGYDGGRDAVALAKAIGAERITLVNAYPHDPIRSRAASPAYEVLQQEDSDRLLKATRAEIGVDAELLAVPDLSPAHALHRVAEERQADLLVVGSAHHGPLGRLLLGDVSRAVLHGSPCPVAVAPKRFRGESPRQVAVGADGSPESLVALDVAHTLADQHGAALTVYVVWEDPPMPVVAAAGSAGYIAEAVEERRTWAERLLADTLRDLPGSTAGHLLHGQAGSALEKASADHDLFVVGSRSWGPVRRIALGSTSDWLVHHAACPVIVVPRPAVPATDREPAGTTAGGEAAG